jgi:hypothetical protein
MIMRNRLLLSLPLLLIFTACGALVQVQRYDQPRPMVCMSAIPTFDVTTYEVPTGMLNPGDTIQILGYVTRLGWNSGKYLAKAGSVMVGIADISSLADLAWQLPQQAGIAAPETTQVQTQTQATTQRQSPTTDKPLGLDEKGRQLYQGPEGGIYYFNKSGNKTYVTKKYKKKK